MKNLSKEQIAVLLISVLAIVLLALNVISISPSVSGKDAAFKFQSSVDSVENADAIYEYISESTYSEPKEIMNFEVAELVGKVEEPKDDTPQISYRWINTNELQLFGKDKISFSMFINGKARFSINGKTKEINVGDMVKIGNTIQKQVVAGTNRATGNTRPGKDYSGKVLAISERSVYVDTDLKNSVVQYRPGQNGRLYGRNLMQSSTQDDDVSVPDDDNDNGTPRRPGRGR